MLVWASLLPTRRIHRSEALNSRLPPTLQAWSSTHQNSTWHSWGPSSNFIWQTPLASQKHRYARRTRTYLPVGLQWLHRKSPSGLGASRSLHVCCADDPGDEVGTWDQWWFKQDKMADECIWFKRQTDLNWILRGRLSYVKSAKQLEWASRHRECIS